MKKIKDLDQEELFAQFVDEIKNLSNDDLVNKLINFKKHFDRLEKQVASYKIDVIKHRELISSYKYNSALNQLVILCNSLNSESYCFSELEISILEQSIYNIQSVLAQHYAKKINEKGWHDFKITKKTKTSKQNNLQKVQLILTE